ARSHDLSSTARTLGRATQDVGVGPSAAVTAHPIAHPIIGSERLLTRRHPPDEPPCSAAWFGTIRDWLDPRNVLQSSVQGFDSLAASQTRATSEARVVELSPRSVGRPCP